jgi:hypothetical protein
MGQSKKEDAEGARNFRGELKFVGLAAELGAAYRGPETQGKEARWRQDVEGAARLMYNRKKTHVARLR